LNYNWRTKAATDDLHHHRSMQVKMDDHTFSSKNCMDTKEQSGFNAEQIERINIRRVKPFED
jgi:hypothetical protein